MGAKKFYHAYLILNMHCPGRIQIENYWFIHNNAYLILNKKYVFFGINSKQQVSNERKKKYIYIIVWVILNLFFFSFSLWKKSFHIHMHIRMVTCAEYVVSDMCRICCKGTWPIPNLIPIFFFIGGSPVKQFSHANQKPISNWKNVFNLFIWILWKTVLFPSFNTN